MRRVKKKYPVKCFQDHIKELLEWEKNNEKPWLNDIKMTKLLRGSAILFESTKYIKEDVRLPGTNIILEKGDKIKILIEDEEFLKAFKKGFYVVGLPDDPSDPFNVIFNGDISEEEFRYGYEAANIKISKVPPKVFLDRILNFSMGHKIIYTYLDDGDFNIGNQLLKAITIFDYNLNSN